MLLEKKLAQVGEGEAGIENVLDNEDVLAFNGLVEVLDELDGAGGALAFAVAGDGDKVEGGVGLNGARQVRQKGCGALEHTDHDQLFTAQVMGDLSAHLGDAFGDLLTGKENLEALTGDGSRSEEHTSEL